MEHGPPASALTAEDVTELARILDEVESRFAEDFTSGRIAGGMRPFDYATDREMLDESCWEPWAPIRRERVGT